MGHEFCQMNTVYIVRVQANTWDSNMEHLSWPYLSKKTSSVKNTHVFFSNANISFCKFSTSPQR